MKRTVLVVCVFLAASALPAQEATKAGAKSAGLGKKVDNASNEEANIRAYIELLRTDTRNTKSQIISDIMALDAAQSAKFWPIYKEFEADYTAVGDKIVAALRKYSDEFTNISDSVADQLANQVLTIEQERNALKKKYYARFKAGVGAITAARFLQVENQLERIVDLQMAAQLPVIGQP